MSETLLPDFDGPRDADPALAPKLPRRKPAKKKAKRAASASKPAKRVPKKRRVRKIANPIIIAPTSDELGASDIQIIKRVGALLAMPKEERNLVIAIVQSLPDK